MVDVFDDRVVLLLDREVHQIVVVVANHRHVGRNDHHVEIVNLPELERLRIGSAGHAGKFLVDAKVVLKGRRRQGLTFVLNRNAFFGLHGLMESVGPPPPVLEAAGELVNDDHLAVPHHILLVPLLHHLRG